MRHVRIHQYINDGGRVTTFASIDGGHAICMRTIGQCEDWCKENNVNSDSWWQAAQWSEDIDSDQERYYSRWIDTDGFCYIKC